MSQGTRQEANAAFAGLGTPSTFRSMYDGEEGAVSLFAEPEEQRELLEGMEGTTVQVRAWRCMRGGAGALPRLRHATPAAPRGRPAGIKRLGGFGPQVPSVCTCHPWDAPRLPQLARSPVCGTRSTAAAAPPRTHS
jgi:hypothetical protein